MSRTYYTLLVKFNRGDKWSIQFGDYNKFVVGQELEDEYSDVWDTRIIRTWDTQTSVDAEVSRLNVNLGV